VLLINAIWYTHFNHNRYNSSKLDQTLLYSTTNNPNNARYPTAKRPRSSQSQDTHILYNDKPTYTDVEVVYLTGAVDIHNGLTYLHVLGESGSWIIYWTVSGYCGWLSLSNQSWASDPYSFYHPCRISPSVVDLRLAIWLAYCLWIFIFW